MAFALRITFPQIALNYLNIWGNYILLIKLCQYPIPSFTHEPN